MQCDNIEDIAKKLEMFHSYEEQICRGDSVSKKPEYVCTSCGYKTTGFYGKCPSCKEFNTLEMIETAAVPQKNLMGVKKKSDKSEKLGSISENALKRYSSGYDEFDRVHKIFIMLNLIRVA